MTKLGFSFSKLPLLNKKDERSIDYAALNSLVDLFIEKGGRYFDTAFTYLGGASEEAIRLSLCERYPRESFILSDKLPSWLLQNRGDCKKIFEKQLFRLGVDFFDVYMIHWLNEANYINAEFCGAFDFLEEIRAEGKAIKTGFSFQGTPELLEKILLKHGEIDFVELQINYLDWESPALLAKECYEIAKKHGKKIIVTEPFKGKSLVKLPAEAEKLFSEKGILPADGALRFAKNLPNVEKVLCQIETAEQLLENLEASAPLSEEETSLLFKAAEIIRLEKAVPCAGCSGCENLCPIRIPIPKYFEIYNEYSRNPEESWKIEPSYSSLTQKFSRPSDCMRCHLCESACPQNISIIETLQRVARTFGF